MKQRTNGWLPSKKDAELSDPGFGSEAGWRRTVKRTHGVSCIHELLLDKDGKIIAKGLRGEDLDKKLAELLNTK